MNKKLHFLLETLQYDDENSGSLFMLREVNFEMRWFNQIIRWPDIA
jgi:hypothetical protein